jgi:hypothetical protein
MNGRTNESSVTRRQVKQISEPARACVVSGLRYGSGLGLLALVQLTSFLFISATLFPVCSSDHSMQLLPANVRLCTSFADKIVEYVT